jgi:hypothetical protein
MEYDVFISYRREGGYTTAKHLFDLLSRDGYKVSFDIDTLTNGDFDVELLKRIDECKDFIIILDKNVFDRCFSADKKHDWLRNELAYALEKEKNIIPVMLEGFTEFPQNLPEDIADVARKNSPKYDKFHFDGFYAKLKDFVVTPVPKLHKKSFSWKMATAIIAILCVIIGGFVVYELNQPFDATIQVVDWKDRVKTTNLNNSIFDYDFKIQISLGDKEYIKPINTDFITLENVPAKFRNRQVEVKLKENRDWLYIDGDIILKEKSKLRIYVRGLESICGYITDLQTGMPVDSAIIEVSGLSPVFSDENGFYKLPIPIQNQEEIQTIDVRKFGYKNGQKSPSLPNRTNGAKNINFKLEKL